QHAVNKPFRIVIPPTADPIRQRVLQAMSRVFAETGNCARFKESGSRRTALSSFLIPKRQRRTTSARQMHYFVDAAFSSNGQNTIEAGCRQAARRSR
uniref:Astacin n=1 Tax=Macrostomum lignano TaxID=282301 RepID=A0A1I8FH88_9PLAT